ncbi:MAG: hypothetical protein JWM41_1759 [Gemmatimonadetes bacterium]|nr:hypothetical protein [Gemmatimonadota bacterium]
MRNSSQLSPAPAQSRRIDSVDLLRGVIMILMALDHTRDYIGNPNASPTNLATTTAALFFTRWVTHVCAPTFSLLTGVGAFLMLRRKTTREVSWFLFTRGVWLIVLEATVMRFLWQFNVDYHVTFLTVLWGLGWSMIVLSALVHLPIPGVATIAIAVISLQNLTDHVAEPSSGVLRVLGTILFRQGALVARPGTFVFTAYPIVAWSAIMALGFALGPVFTWDAPRRRRFLTQAGLAAVALFIVLRAINGYGDPRPWSVQGTSMFTVLSYLNVTKQPPSLFFVLMTIGPGLLFLAAFDSYTPRLLRPVVTIGRVPMFYFVAHVLVIHLIATVEAAIRYHSVAMVTQSPTPDQFPFAQPPGWPASLPWVYAAWILAVLLLYPCCKWYARYKATHTAVWLSYL